MKAIFRLCSLFVWLVLGCREGADGPGPGTQAWAEIRRDTGEHVVFGKGMVRSVQPLTGTPRTVPIGKPDVVSIGSNTTTLKARVRVGPLALSRPAEYPCVEGSERVGERVRPIAVIAPVGLPERRAVGELSNREGSTGKFSFLNARHGLPTSVIRDMLVDRDGYLWISTTGGVGRFDGTSLTVYSRKQGLLGNDITAMCQDRQGNIWLGTYGGVLIRFDGRTFTQYPGKQHIIYSLTEDADGRIWGGTKEAGAFHFRQGEFTYYGREQGWPDMVTDIVIDGEGKRWLASPAGLFIDNGECLLDAGIGTGCTAIAIDSSRQIWFAAAGQLYSADVAGIFAYAREPADRRSSINALCFDPKGNLWIATVESGLQVFNGRTFIAYGAHDGLPGKGADGLVVDKDGGVWAKDQEHVIRFNGSAFTDFSGSPGMTLPAVTALFMDSRDRLWMSAFGGDGIFCLDGNRLEQYARRQGWPANGFMAMVEDHQGALWIAFWDIGLCRFDGKGVTTYTRANGLYSDQIHSLALDRDGNVWCASDHAIMRFEPGRSRFVNYVSDGKVCSRVVVAGLHGDVWAASCNGLYRFNPAADSSVVLYRHLGRSLEALRVDGEGHIWTAPYEDGLYHFDGKKSVHFSGDALAVANTLGAITDDQAGTLWIGTFSSGLLKLDMSSFNAWYAAADSMPMDSVMTAPVNIEEVITRFSHEDGFLPHTVHQRAAATGRNGDLWFGTSEGVTRVEPRELASGKSPPLVRVAGVRLFNQEMDWSKPGSNQQRLAAYKVETEKIRYDSITPFTGLPVRPSFPHTADNITFQFGGIDLGNPEKLRYQFQLQGHGNTWSSASPSSEVNYGTLAPGSYTFRVRGRHPGGAWSEAGEYPFTIRPPWWNTLWARLAYFSLAVGLFYRLRRIELKRQQLTFSLRLEQVEAERLKELDMVKSRLYTNITHEFRTPLTVILGMADQMESKPADPVKDRVRMIRRNGRHLLSLVNQMLDLAKIESHQMNLHLIQGDLAAYLGYVAESFRSLADQKDIRIRVIRPEAGVTMDFDEAKMLQVLSNLLSNAIKFTPPGGEVTVTIGQERGELIVEVADTGVGIHPDQLPFIFNKFYQADNSHTRQGEGTGIGLTLTKELVGLMGGHIGVESRPGQGTVFTVRVPIRHTADVRPIAWGPLDEPHAGHVAEDASAPGESASVTDMAGERPLVLVIEDNMDVMTYLVSCLGEAFQVVKAMDGITGIGKALEIVPDLVITDVMMPGKDGFEVCDTLKRDMRTSHVPVIILTAKASMEDRIAGLARGADVYLAKPFHPEELLIHIGNLIALRKRLQERYQHLDATPPASASADEQVEDAFLLRLRELIEAELDNADLSIEDICKRMAMSRMQLHRKIKALTDRSTSIYIRSIRLAHGRRLLAAGELNVSQTAYAVGFEDPNYFSRVFQEEFGILPSDVKAGQA